MKTTIKEKVKSAPHTTRSKEAHKEATVREAVGIFHDPEKLQAAIDELQNHGFTRHEISVLAGEHTIREKLGHIYRHSELAEDDPKAPRTMFIANEEVRTAESLAIGVPLFIAAVMTGGAVVASGGLVLDALIYAATAGAVGAGIGSVLATFIAQQRAEYLQKQIEHGGLLLWVNVRSARMEKLAEKILMKNSAQDVHVHNMPVYR